jgi:hypothetical protein
MRTYSALSVEFCERTRFSARWYARWYARPPKNRRAYHAVQPNGSFGGAPIRDGREG